jgi:anti-sigma regulatory factor (Ser/Thr protein kinase)
LKIVGDTQVSGEKIGSLIQFFEKLICFDVATKEKFSDAMMEAAANTVEHAYKSDGSTKTIKKWWLTASINKKNNEISFVFYDQGAGILNTLESIQKYIKLKRLVAGWIAEGVSKGGILKNLTTTNLLSYKSKRRENGLISFKLFIDEVQDGELTIHTDDVSYSAVSDEIINYNSFIRGTMIAWKIKVGDDKCI